MAVEPRVGMKLHGYCDGYFGESYGEKTIEAFGIDWIVVRDANTGLPIMAIEEGDYMLVSEEWLEESEK